MKVLKVCNRCGDLHPGTHSVCDRCYRPRPRTYTQQEKSKPSRRLYATAAWKRTRAEVLTRDNHECQGCGTPNKLSVHHLEPADTCPDPLDPANLLTLCRRCHTRADNARRANTRIQARTQP